MEEKRAAARREAVRVEYPLEASFAGENFEVSEFTLNLSVSGIFLPTTRFVEPRTLGKLTFRDPQWAKPLTVEGEVVRAVPAEDPTGQPQGLGIQFLQLSPEGYRRLERLVSEDQEGSAVDAIRQAVHDGKDLLTELRHRPTGEKMMLATRAQSSEIDALIRDGNPTVVSRLLENPRITTTAIKQILRQPTMAPGILLKVKRKRWLVHPELNLLYCMHPLVPAREAVSMVRHLNVPQLMIIERNPDLSRQLRTEAKKLLDNRKAGAPAGR